MERKEKKCRKKRGEKLSKEKALGKKERNYEEIGIWEQ